MTRCLSWCDPYLATCLQRQVNLNCLNSSVAFFLVTVHVDTLPDAQSRLLNAALLFVAWGFWFSLGVFVWFLTHTYSLITEILNTKIYSTFLFGGWSRISCLLTPPHSMLVNSQSNVLFGNWVIGSVADENWLPLPFWYYVRSSDSSFILRSISCFSKNSELWNRGYVKTNQKVWKKFPKCLIAIYEIIRVGWQFWETVLFSSRNYPIACTILRIRMCLWHGNLYSA